MDHYRSLLSMYIFVKFIWISNHSRIRLWDRSCKGQILSHKFEIIQNRAPNWQRMRPVWDIKPPLDAKYSSNLPWNHGSHYIGLTTRWQIFCAQTQGGNEWAKTNQLHSTNSRCIFWFIPWLTSSSAYAANSKISLSQLAQQLAQHGPR